MLFVKWLILYLDGLHLTVKESLLERHLWKQELLERVFQVTVRGFCKKYMSVYTTYIFIFLFLTLKYNGIE